MKSDRLYDIAFVGLKNGLHEFNYNIEDKFFSDYKQPEFTDAGIHIKLLFNKESSFFLLKFEITGKVTIPCDRCNQPFRLNIWEEFNQVVKLVDNPELMEDNSDPEVSYIARTASHLNVAGWIYEFILLSIPVQHIHPDTPGGKSTCDPAVIKMLEAMQQHDAHNIENPIWKDLEKFKK